ncbi:MAG TPA: dicarboxylate/amino acid:cation symporter [Acidaminococcaceae bacterium]|nr:dicarboxylate/amino acid:cation symporter [Acidaminococcaceae bacterium]
MSKMNENNKLAIRMLAAMVLGIVFGLVCMAARESLGATSGTWQTINNILFQDITAKGANQAIGIFYLGGQLFIRSLQLIIVPMVFTSIVMALCEIREASTLGRVAGKTIGWFLFTSILGLIIAGAVGYFFYSTGAFSSQISGLKAHAGSAGANPLIVILNIIPANIGAAMSVNNAVLSIVFLAIGVGLSMNFLKMDKQSAVYRLCQETSDIIVVFLNYVVKKFGPVAIFMLLSRTFATYGIAWLRPAVAYVVICVVLLLLYLLVGYPSMVGALMHLNPITFIRKVFRVIVFGFSTSSSAATLPLNIDTNVNGLGVDRQIASFVLPLGMTINMDGTAIYMGVCTLFIANVFGVHLTMSDIIMVIFTGTLASIGTAGVPGAGLIMLAMVLQSVQLPLEGLALVAGIDRVLDMFRTTVNITGDVAVASVVDRSERKRLTNENAQVIK